LTNASGAIVQSYNYRPFGEGIEHPGELSTNHLFTGEYYDSNLDYYYLRARYYSPGLGRFTGYDPVEDANNKLHKYVYCGNDGINLNDLSGMTGTDYTLPNLLAAASIVGLLGSICLTISTGSIWLYADSDYEAKNSWRICDAIKIGIIAEGIEIGSPGKGFGMGAHFITEAVYIVSEGKWYSYNSMGLSFGNFGRGIGIIITLLWNVDRHEDIEGPYQSTGLSLSRFMQRGLQRMGRHAPPGMRHLVLSAYLSSGFGGLVTNLFPNNDCEGYYKGRFVFGVYFGRTWFGKYNRKIPRLKRSPGWGLTTTIRKTFPGRSFGLADFYNSRYRVPPSSSQSLQFIQSIDEGMDEYLESSILGYET
jgi:RHS repeat-associated protein